MVTIQVYILETFRGWVISSTGEHTSHTCCRFSWTGSIAPAFCTYLSRQRTSVSRGVFSVATSGGSYVCRCVLEGQVWRKHNVLESRLCVSRLSDCWKMSEYFCDSPGHFFCCLRSYAQVAPRHGVRRAYLSTVELSLFSVGKSMPPQRESSCGAHSCALSRT